MVFQIEVRLELLEYANTVVPDSNADVITLSLDRKEDELALGMIDRVIQDLGESIITNPLHVVG